LIVLERGPLAGEASHVAAGMLAPVSEAEFGEDDVLAFNLAGARRWPEWAAELREASGRDPGLRRCGTLMVARDADEAEALERLLEFRRGLGLEVERLRPSEARRLEPALAPTVRLALHVPEDHAADPRLTCAALAEAARRAGAVLRTQAPVAAVRAGSVALADGTAVEAPQVVLAAGSWSGQVAGAEPPIPVVPQRGQILALANPDRPLRRVVLKPEDPYLVPRVDGRVIVGATREFAGYDRSLTAGGVAWLLASAIEMVPAFAGATIHEVWTGFRPVSADGMPIIGAAAIEGLFYATGHGASGVGPAPGTAALLAALVLGKRPPIDAAPFSPKRFASVPSPGGRGLG
jgi:glycine oxidase